MSLESERDQLLEPGMPGYMAEQPPVEAYSGDVSKPAQQPKKKSILDEDRHYCSVDLLRHVDDGHLLKKLCLQLSAVANIPPSTVFLMALGVVSSMTCRRWAVLYYDGQRLVIGLYAVAEQPSGTGKSRCLRVFQEPFADAYFAAKKRVAKEISLLEGRTDLTDAQKQQLERLNIQQKILSGPLFITNATPEGLETGLNYSGGFFAAVSPEQGLLNSLLGLLYGQSANNNDVVLNGFDGGYVTSLRISRTAYSGRVVGALACFAQPGSIETVIENSQGTGYAERFLMLAEKHLLGSRDHTKRTVLDPGLLREYKNATGFSANIFENPRGYDDLSLLKLSDAAYEEIAIFRNEIERHLADGGRYSHTAIRGAAAKIDIQIMKIAANLHLMSQHRIKNQIDDGIVIAAIGIAHDLLEANLTLCTHKGIVGQSAEYASIIALFEKDARQRSERAIINAKRQTKPFSDFTGNRSERVRHVLNEMVELGLLVRATHGEKILYTLGQ